MLLELAIRDFAIIDATTIPFEGGFNALTGETGAGKSILVDALGAVLGERVGADVVRSGAKAARVEATFDVTAPMARPEVAAALAEAGVEPEDGVLIFAREIGANGRSSARVNGRAVTAGALARIGALLVDIHGQSDHLSLLRPAEHLEMLDRYAGLGAARAKLAAVVADLRGVRSRIADVTGNARERAQRADLLRFQVDEIAGANLRPGEDDDLLAERSVLANAERLAEDAAAAYAALAGADDFDALAAGLPALPAIRQAAARMADAAGLDPAAKETADRLAELGYLLEDAAAEVRAYRDRIEADPARLAAIEERLDEIKSLKRKYGATLAEVIAFGESAARELDGFEGAEADVDALRAREAALREEAGRLASDLSARRRAAGTQLAEAVEHSIAELNMGRSVFEVRIVQQEDAGGVPFVGENGAERLVAIDASGADRVEFLLAANPGEAPKPLARVASGGETARLMLALKSILSDADETPTLVFDEVDVGVGGRSGQVVGEKLWGLSSGHQVVVITHLPQIAAFADAHFRIAKGFEDGRTISRVEPLAGEERLDEVAAMLDGVPVTAAARRNAEAMVERADAWKRGRGAGANGRTGRSR
jgi:DNA repair protein RecN (Recombination protein N)